MVEEAEKSNEVEGITKTTPETQEATAQIPEESKKEDAETLRKEVDKLRAYESNFKSLQQKYQKLIDDQKGSGDVRRDVADLKEMIKLMAAAQSQGINATPEELEELPKKQQKNIIADWEREKRAEREREDYQTKAVRTYNEAEEVFGDDVDTLHNMRNLIRAGDFDLAEKKIAKAKEKTLKQQEAKESEADMRKRLEKEIKEQIFKEKGWNVTDTGSPSGGTSPDTEFLKEFSEGKRNSPEDFKRASKLIAT